MSHIRIELRITVGTDLEHLSILRSHVVCAARDFGADDDTIGDFELVVSELATNVMQHTKAEELTIAFQRSEDTWVLDVSDAHELADFGTLVPAAADEIDGRGLFIVRTLMDSVEIVTHDERQLVRCKKIAA